MMISRQLLEKTDGWIAKMKCAARLVDATSVLIIHFAECCILDKRKEEKRQRIQEDRNPLRNKRCSR